MDKHGAALADLGLDYTGSTARMKNDRFGVAQKELGPMQFADSVGTNIDARMHIIGFQYTVNAGQ